MEPVLANLPVQRLGGYPENGRGSTLVPVRTREDTFDVAPFDLRHEGAHAIRTNVEAGLSAFDFLVQNICSMVIDS